MRSTFSILFYINRGKVKADGTTAVMCRITIDGRSTAITTGIYCRPEDWNAKTGTTRTVRESARLQEYRKYIERTYEDILRTQGVVSAEIIKAQVTKQFVVPTHLLQMGEIERERLRIRSKEINSVSTYRHSQYFQKYLADYLTSLGRKDIAFEEITEDFGKGYKAFLVRNKNFSSTQTNRCLCWLNRLLYLAVDNEILRKYSINSLVYWVTYVHNVVYSFYRSMIYCYINSTQRCAGSIVIDIIPTNGADKRKFFPFAPYFPVTNVIKRYFYPYFPAIIGIKGYSFPYFPYLSGIMKIKTALYSLFSRLDWHKTVVFPCLGEIYEGIRSLSWEIPVT